MIRYNLICDKEHEFEGWFANSEAFDKQKEAKQLLCSVCGSKKVSKALMAPGIPAKSNAAPAPLRTSENEASNTVMNEAIEAVRKIKEYVKNNADYVGDKFAEEARKIHYEETEPRGIYGEATASEIKELNDEGVACTPLPDLPEDKN